MQPEILKYTVIIVLLITLIGITAPSFRVKKVILQKVEKEASSALSQFPELQSTSTKFIMKPSLRKSFINRSSFQLIAFGIRYYFSSGFIKKAEHSPDFYTVKSGLTDYILTTKYFILKYADLLEKHKSHIKKNHLSPDQIRLLAWDEDKLKQGI